MPSIRPRRTALYVPGSNLRAVEKAANLAADVIIFDLEDAVAPAEKEAARSHIAGTVDRLQSQAGGRGQELVVRVNAIASVWGPGDLAVVAAVRPDAILLPKIGGPEDLARARQMLGQSAPTLARRHMAVWAMIETPLAALSPLAVASQQDDRFPLDCLVLGLNDLALETRVRSVPGRAPMMPWMMNALAAARVAGIDILDGVFNDIRDSEGFVQECAAARDCGFDGKTIIHPSQISIANDAFRPSVAEISAARQIVELFERPENAHVGVVQFEGRMVERLHGVMAERVLRLAEAVQAREQAA